MNLRDLPVFEYMRFAKFVQNEGPYNLTCSGAPSLKPGEIDCSDLSLNTKQPYGEPALKQAIAKRYGVAADEVFLATGTSGVNFLLLGAILSDGDEVVVESPAYEVLWKLPRVFGARSVRWDRKGRDFKLDPDSLASLVTPRTRAVLITNHHNPSGKFAGQAEIEGIARFTSERGIYLVVDEVYLDMLESARSARTLGGLAVSTASLTKTCGLGGLRIGWALAPAQVVEAADRFHDLASVNCPSPSMSIAQRAFDMIDDLLGRSRALARRNCEIVDSWIRSVDGLEWSRPDGVLFGFPRITCKVRSSDLFEELAAKHGAYIVPGRFFDGMEDGFRLGFGVKEEILEQGLSRIGKALESLVTCP